MTVQNSTAVRNAMLDVMETTMGTTVSVRLRSGAQPANCATASSGTLIALFTLASDWASAASGGAKAFSGTPLSTTAANAGTVGHYEILDSAGTTCHERGSVTATGGGGDMTIDNVILAASQAVQITGFTKTAPGA